MKFSTSHDDHDKDRLIRRIPLKSHLIHYWSSFTVTSGTIPDESSDGDKTAATARLAVTAVQIQTDNAGTTLTVIGRYVHPTARMLHAAMPPGQSSNAHVVARASWRQPSRMKHQKCQTNEVDRMAHLVYLLSVLSYSRFAKDILDTTVQTVLYMLLQNGSCRLCSVLANILSSIDVSPRTWHNTCCEATLLSEGHLYRHVVRPAAVRGS